MLIFAAPLAAETVISISTGIIGGGQYLGAKTVDNQTTVGVLGVNSSNSTVVNGLAGVTLSAQETAVAVVTGSAVNLQAGKHMGAPVAGVLTPMVTPGYTPSTTYTLVNRFNAVATAAPTAVYHQLPLSSTVPGKAMSVQNDGASPFNFVPVGGDAINALAAGTPYACATTKNCTCTEQMTGRWICVSQL
jgi:hypothetical protein